MREIKNRERDSESESERERDRKEEEEEEEEKRREGREYIHVMTVARRCRFIHQLFFKKETNR